MSYLSNELVQCETLQARLDEFWQEEGTEGADDSSALAEFLASPTNRRRIQQEILPGGGKRRRVRMTYFQRFVEDDVQEDVQNPLCEASDKYGNLSQDYEMTAGNIGHSINVDINDLTEYCGDNGAYLLKVISELVDVVERKTMSQWADESVMLAGSWGALGQSNSLFAPGTAAGQINSNGEYVWTTRLASGAINPESWWDLRFALNKIGYGGNVAIIGGSTGFKYFGATQVGCCADTGIDVANAMMSYGYGYAYDKRLVSAFGAGGENKLMVIKPGSIVPLAYVKNAWKDGVPPVITNSATFVHTSIFGRRLGIPMDLTINQPCGTEVSIGVSASTQLITVPNDQFQTNDPYFGKTGAAKVTITNP